MSSYDIVPAGQFGSFQPSKRETNRFNHDVLAPLVQHAQRTDLGFQLGVAITRRAVDAAVEIDQIVNHASNGNASLDMKLADIEREGMWAIRNIQRSALRPLY